MDARNRFKATFEVLVSSEHADEHDIDFYLEHELQQAFHGVYGLDLEQLRVFDIEQV